MHHTDKYSEHSSVIWSVWPNGWVFVYELSGSGFDSSCSHFTFRFRAWFEQGVPWHSDNYRMWIHSETRMWHDKKIRCKILFGVARWRGIFHRSSVYKTECSKLGLGLAYSSRYCDMISRFGRSVVDLYLKFVINQILIFFRVRFSHLFSSLYQTLLSSEYLANLANPVYYKRRALDNCWSVIDDAVSVCCRSDENQRVLYSGHKYVWGIKFLTQRCRVLLFL